VTRRDLEAAVLRLEIPAALTPLAEIFPETSDPSVAWDYAEPPGPRTSQAYAAEHATVFAPMRRQFDLIREIATAITHEVGALG
jgi:phosphoenolpyruvate carboxylase